MFAHLWTSIDALIDDSKYFLKEDFIESYMNSKRFKYFYQVDDDILVKNCCLFNLSTAQIRARATLTPMVDQISFMVKLELLQLLCFIVRNESILETILCRTNFPT